MLNHEINSQITVECSMLVLNLVGCLRFANIFLLTFCNLCNKIIIKLKMLRRNFDFT